jgi:hypothetical protein
MTNERVEARRLGFQRIHSLHEGHLLVACSTTARQKWHLNTIWGAGAAGEGESIESSRLEGTKLGSKRVRREQDSSAVIDIVSGGAVGQRVQLLHCGQWAQAGGSGFPGGSRVDGTVVLGAMREAWMSARAVFRRGPPSRAAPRGHAFWSPSNDGGGEGAGRAAGGVRGGARSSACRPEGLAAM